MENDLFYMLALRPRFDNRPIFRQGQGSVVVIERNCDNPRQKNKHAPRQLISDETATAGDRTDMDSSLRVHMRPITKHWLQYCMESCEYKGDFVASPSC